MDVCILSQNEAGRLEHYGIWPNCKQHRHISKNKAKEAAEAGLIRFLGGPDSAIKQFVSMAVLVKIQVWQPVATAGMQGLRTWGLPRTR